MAWLVRIVVGYAQYSNVDFGGVNINTGTDISPSFCAAACTVNQKCAAFEIDKINNLCWLKSGDVSIAMNAFASTQYDSFLKSTGLNHIHNA
jgi:hypothetical protein